MISTFTRMLAACSLLATTALAQTPPPRIQLCAPTQTIPLQSTNWQNNLSFPKFDPALGILVGVQVSLGAQVEVAAIFESLDAQPAVINLTLSGVVDVFRPGPLTSPIVSANPTFMRTESVTAYDGITDYRGTSGRSFPAQLFTQASSMNLGTMSDLTLFTGPSGNPGSITLPVTAAGASIATGAGNLISAFATRAGGDIQVCYLYYPDCNNNQIPDYLEIQGNPNLDRYGIGTCLPDGILDVCQPEADCDSDGLPNRCELVGNDCDGNLFPDNCQPDCDGDGLADACEILAGARDRYGPTTCTPDGIPDSCQVQPDCDNDGIPNRCELVGNDCDANQFPDNCQSDCDGDGLADACEILAGAPDLYGRASCSPDGIPDSCQVLPDCDNDGIPNRCELVGNDCDGNAFPDNCQPDCDGDGIADACEILSGAPDRYGRSTCTPDGVPDSCQAQPDCDNDGLPNRCELVGNDCDGNLFPDNCQPDCDGNGLADVCEILGGARDLYGPTTCAPDGIPDSCQVQPDCDGDGIPDRCELLGGTPDTYGPGTCTADNIPDSCQPEPDCDMDGTPDRCEIAGGAVDRYGRTTCVPDGVPDICQAQLDCDGDGLPDRCELVNNDCDGNLLPDNCQPDCNKDGTIDACEVDCNADGTPDECQALDDCDGNGIPDVCELVGNDCNTNNILDTCEKDCDGNGTPDDCDIATDPTIDSDDDGIPDTCQCLELDRHRPGSLLLFPKYDNRSAQRTLFTVTNTHPSQSIDVHFVFRDGTTCLEFNYSERLTPKDTITLLTRAVNPTANQGYAYAYAQSTTTGQPIVFNHLIGQALAIDGITTFEYALDAVSFEGIGNGMNTNTDVDSDGRRDLDGLEYAQAPDQILIPRFLGQTEVSASEFVFVDLTSGPAFQTVVDYLVYNDNEEAFSGQYQFRCWQCITLTNLAGSFSNAFLSGLSSNDPKEIQGLPGFETGWVRFDGRIAFSNFTQIDDPAIYVVLIERHAGYAAADLPYEVCSQDNGSLLPLGPQGDN